MNGQSNISLYSDIPEIIESPVTMTEPNSVINIFEGPFILKSDEDILQVNGIIYFTWGPDLGVNFTCIYKDAAKEFLKIDAKAEYLDIVIDHLIFGKCLVTGTSTTNLSNDVAITGTAFQKIIKGDQTIPVEKIRFSIPNLRAFHGLAVKKIKSDGMKGIRGRIILDNEDYQIILDKASDYNELNTALNSRGGYLIQYGGELIYKKGSITFENIHDTLSCFDTFITFLNGRRTSAFFVHGIVNSEVKWIDYTEYPLDSYKQVTTWPQKHSIDGINKIWGKFYSIWQNKDDKNFLTSAVHWYVEANGNSGLSEGAIIMAQTALELIYNWLLIENKKILIGKDSENINAANKLRLLLSHLKISYKVPIAFTQLQKFINDNDIIDAPDAIAQIRNAIVHSQMEKRRKLSAICSKTKFEALQLSIHYIELSLLYILEYSELYFDRCCRAKFAKEGEKRPPWI